MNEIVVTGVGTCAGILLIGAGIWHVIYCVDRKLKTRGLLIAAAGAGVNLVTAVLLKSWIAAGFDAVSLAIALYSWWNNGGGDGMKRRLKKWAESFGFGPAAAHGAA